MFQRGMCWFILVGIWMSMQCLAESAGDFVIWMTYGSLSTDCVESEEEFDLSMILEGPAEPERLETATPRRFQATIAATDGTRVLDVPLGINRYLVAGEDGSPLWVEVDLEGEVPRVSLSNPDFGSIDSLWKGDVRLEAVVDGIAIPNLNTILRYMDGKIYYFAYPNAESSPGLYAMDVETREVTTVVSTTWDQIYQGALSDSEVFAFGEGICIGSDVWYVEGNGNWISLTDDLAGEYDAFAEEVAWLNEEVLLFWGYKRKDPDFYERRSYTLLYANIQTGESGYFADSQGNCIRLGWERPVSGMAVNLDRSKIILGLEQDDYFTFDGRYYWVAAIDLADGLTNGRIQYLAPFSMREDSYLPSGFIVTDIF